MAETTTGVDVNVARPITTAPYDARDWYWKRKNGTLFSSARVKEVPATDPEFQAWSDGTRFPTPYPWDENGDESEAELQKELDKYNLSATLPHYIRKRTWELRVAGTTIAGMKVTGDSDTMGLLRGLKDKAEKDPTGTFPFDDGSATGGEITAEQAIGLYDAGTDWVQSTFDKRLELLNAYADGDVTEAADVEEAIAPSTKAAKRKTARAKA